MKFRPKSKSSDREFHQITTFIDNETFEKFERVATDFNITRRSLVKQAVIFALNNID